MNASVLLVEDDVAVATSLERSLRRGGYTVHVAGTVGEALEVLDRVTIDVVVTDLRMPGETGLDLLAHVEQRDALLPVIIVTADPSIDAAATALRHDAFDFLTKPVTREDLLGAVGRALTSRRRDEAARQKQAQREREVQRLAARHERVAALLALLYERGQEGIVLIDQAGRILDVSTSFARLADRPVFDLLERDLQDVFLPHPTAGNLQALVVDLIQRGTMHWRGNVDLRTRAGALTPVRLSLSYCEIADDDGNVAPHVVGLVVHESGHEELGHHLQRADRLATVGLLAGSAAHEIKNELGPLLGLLGLVEQAGREALDDDMVDVIRASVRRMGDHLEQILAPLRPRVRTSGPVLLRGAVDIVVATLRRAGRMRRIEVTIDAPPDDVVVLADKDEVHQIVLNLLTNAIDALPETVGARGRIRLCIGIENGAAQLDVRDDGSGVPADARDRVFEPFFTTKGASGTGLGLAVVHDVVRSLGGRVWLLCPPEGGTAVTVQLPLYRASG